MNQPYISLETLPGRLPDKQPLVGEQQRLGPKHLNESGPCCKWIGPQVGHCNTKKKTIYIRKCQKIAMVAKKHQKLLSKPCFKRIGSQVGYCSGI